MTSQDVARLAGFSQPTVSRALRDDPRVSADTRRRVREAAALLGYVPSQAGRALSSGRTHRIGLLVTDLDNQFYWQIIAPLHRALDGLGYQLMLHTDTGSQETIAERMIADGLDGVILATTAIDSVNPVRLRDRGVPFLYFNRTSSLVAADATVVDSTRGFGEAVDRAVELGHRRIAAVAGPSNTSTGVSREAALRKALAKHGLSLEDRLLLRGPFDDKTGDAAMTELLALAEPPTLVFCGNDVVAYGALNAARRAGVSVPTDISVIGFDDLPAASWAIIDLSTIAYDYPAMVESAARLIVDRVEQPDSDFAQIEFDTRFVERSSLAA
ncbi:MAG TPA: LacI family DNA-binding transcriptional regulator, partial [Microbacteriaceae bacterium]|nr:LacI family DNA-binding transcriptional regulator [Microbacteriaceae bacterium]